MSTNSTSSDRGSISKATLFCLACDRTAPIDGAWPLAKRDDRTDVRCPDCGSVIVSQPEFDSDENALLAV